MKATGIDIIIYVVGFEVSVGSDAESLLKGCATSPQHYFASPTPGSLGKAFTAVANQLTSLRLAE